jgi:hypothetical protein
LPIIRERPIFFALKLFSFLVDASKTFEQVFSSFEAVFLQTKENFLTLNDFGA